MIAFVHRHPALVALLLAGTIGLGACAHRPPVAASAAAPTAAPFDQPAEVDATVAALDRGEIEAARARIDALLAHDPADAAARVLKDSLDEDAKALLGPRSFAYKVKPGETMLDVSGRFLGNRLKFYQLARYNDIAVPASLAAGTTLRIPGAPPRPAPEKAGARRPAVRPKAGAAAPGMPAAPAVRGDPAAARTARAAGLAALAQGNVDRAVVQLRRAAALDPANPLIRRDLDRAERINRTVKARK